MILSIKPNRTRLKIEVSVLLIIYQWINEIRRNFALSAHNLIMPMHSNKMENDVTFYDSHKLSESTNASLNRIMSLTSVVNDFRCQLNTGYSENGCCLKLPKLDLHDMFL